MGGGEGREGVRLDRGLTRWPRTCPRPPAWRGDGDRGRTRRVSLTGGRERERRGVDSPQKIALSDGKPDRVLPRLLTGPASPADGCRGGGGGGGGDEDYWGCGLLVSYIIDSISWVLLWRGYYLTRIPGAAASWYRILSILSHGLLLLRVLSDEDYWGCGLLVSHIIGTISRVTVLGGII
ncbi:unnamed protein product [Ascophyllum nodosum]